MAQVTTIELTPGAAPVHVTVFDQRGADGGGQAIVPADVTWALDPSLAGVIVAADATGFDFSAPTGTAAETGNATATYVPNGATGVLVETVQFVITGLTFASP